MKPGKTFCKAFLKLPKYFNREEPPRNWISFVVILLHSWGDLIPNSFAIFWRKSIWICVSSQFFLGVNHSSFHSVSYLKSTHQLCLIPGWIFFNNILIEPLCRERRDLNPSIFFNSFTDFLPQSLGFCIPSCPEMRSKNSLWFVLSFQKPSANDFWWLNHSLFNSISLN